jgi:hypothetical protein
VLKLRDLAICSSEGFAPCAGFCAHPTVSSFCAAFCANATLLGSTSAPSTGSFCSSRRAKQSLDRFCPGMHIPHRRLDVIVSGHVLQCKRIGVLPGLRQKRVPHPKEVGEGSEAIGTRETLMNLARARTCE